MCGFGFGLLNDELPTLKVVSQSFPWQWQRQPLLTSAASRIKRLKPFRQGVRLNGPDMLSGLSLPGQNSTNRMHASTWGKTEGALTLSITIAATEKIWMWKVPKKTKPNHNVEYEWHNVRLIKNKKCNIECVTYPQLATISTWFIIRALRGQNIWDTGPQYTAINWIKRSQTRRRPSQPRNCQKMKS